MQFKPDHKEQSKENKNVWYSPKGGGDRRNCSSTFRHLPAKEDPTYFKNAAIQRPHFLQFVTHWPLFLFFPPVIRKDHDGFITQKENFDQNYLVFLIGYITIINNYVRNMGIIQGASVLDFQKML